MNHIGRETILEVGGKKYTLSRFTRKQLAAFLDWADAKLPNPLDQIRNKLDGFPKDIQEMLVKDAIERARLRKSLNNPDVQELMRSNEGLTKIITLLIQKHHPELSDEQAEEVFDNAVIEHGDDYLAKKIMEATGVVVDDKEAEPSFPKPTARA